MKTELVPILVAEDDLDDQLLLQQAFIEAQVPNPMRCVENGEQLLDFLYRRGAYADAPRPGLILLDLNMPRMDGREALREIKSDASLQDIPVVVLTTSSSDEDRSFCHRLGARSFITKPRSFEGLVQVVGMLSCCS
jgi:CheY-like chemotaxis protein